MYLIVGALSVMLSGRFVVWWFRDSQTKQPNNYTTKSITDNADATDLFFHGFFVFCWIYLRLSGAMIVTDYLLLKAIQRRIGANAIRVRFATEFF